MNSELFSPKSRDRASIGDALRLAPQVFSNVFIEFFFFLILNDYPPCIIKIVQRYIPPHCVSRASNVRK